MSEEIKNEAVELTDEEIAKVTGATDSPVTLTCPECGTRFTYHFMEPTCPNCYYDLSEGS